MRFLPSIKKAASHNITSVVIENDGVCAVQIVRGLEKRSHDAKTNASEHTPAVTSFSYKANREGVSTQTLLQEISNELKLKDHHCTTVLNSNDYNLLIAEAPEVPAEEMMSALNWRVKDLIDTPINETTLEVFPAPAPAGEQTTKSLYVVAATDAVIQKRIDQLTQAQINLQTIDITEMALRNIAALTPEAKEGVAFIWLHEEGGIVTVFRDGELYMNRQMSSGTKALFNEQSKVETTDNIILELQRSLDYFESQFRQNPIRHIVLAPSIQSLSLLETSLTQVLGVNAKTLDFTELLTCNINMPDNWQSEHLIAIGAALRYEEENPSQEDAA